MFGFDMCALCPSDAQLTRERVIQTVDSAVQGGDGRNLALGLHQLPVRPVTQNGKHTTAAAAVATVTSFANASGETLLQSLHSHDDACQCFCSKRWIQAIKIQMWALYWANHYSSKLLLFHII